MPPCYLSKGGNLGNMPQMALKHVSFGVEGLRLGEKKTAMDLRSPYHVAEMVRTSVRKKTEFLVYSCIGISSYVRSRASHRFEKRLNFSINPQKLSIFSRTEVKH